MMEKLVNVIHSYPCIWKTDDENYRNSEIRDMVWKNIVKRFHFGNVHKAKYQWKKIREAFRRTLKEQRNGKKNLSIKFNRESISFEQMAFLKPYMKEGRRNSDTISIETIYNNTNIEEYALLQLEDNLDKNMKIYTEEPVNENILINEEPHRKKIRIQENPNNFTLLMNKQEEIIDVRHEEKVQEEVSECQSRNILKEFFNSMYLTTITLPKSSQLMIKRKLFDAVNEAEMNLQKYEWNSG